VIGARSGGHQRGDDEAAALVLVPGLGMGPDVWQPQLTTLSRHHRVFTPRLHHDGDGRSFSVTAAAASLAGVIADRAGGRAHVCGLAFGAIVAARLALDYPDRVNKLILSGASLRANRVLHAARGLLLGALPTRLYPQGDKHARLAGWRELGMCRPEADFARISAPTMVMCGSRDRASTTAARALAAGIPDAVLTIVPGVGRQWNRTRPELFNEIVVGFLADTGPSELDELLIPDF